MEINIDSKTKGVRIITGDQCRLRRKLLNQFIELAEFNRFNEITLPCIEPQSIYTDKAGNEILNQMYVFKDKGDRDICLRPEGTATIQLIAQKHYKRTKDVKLWYFTPCWRYERPATGRYREFYQFGVEWLNPSDIEIAYQFLLETAITMIRYVTNEKIEIDNKVKRGLDYYIENGFEISIPSLGAEKQVVGGGRYKEGIGFAVGFDRLMLKYNYGQ
jgi:histidyl-tRNA synthetase